MSGLIPQGQMPTKNSKTKKGQVPTMSRANLLELMQQLPQQALPPINTLGANG